MHEHCQRFVLMHTRTEYLLGTHSVAGTALITGNTAGRKIQCGPASARAGRLLTQPHKEVQRYKHLQEGLGHGGSQCFEKLSGGG